MEKNNIPLLFYYKKISVFNKKEPSNNDRYCFSSKYNTKRFICVSFYKKIADL